MFWNELVNWFNQYSTGIYLFFTAGIGGTSLVLFRKYLLNVGQKIMNILIKVVVKLYGGNVTEDEVTSAFEALPFVQDLKAQAAQIREDNELKLVQIKQKILSPKLSEVERVSYEYQYNTLFNKLDGALSESTKAVLEKMETLAHTNKL